MRAFHYAFKVKDIQSTKVFYIDILGCNQGRFTESWIDFDFFGNQLSAHISNNIPKPDYCGTVDGVKVPIPHYGCILTLNQFEDVRLKLEKSNCKFIVKPQIRYKGLKGEQQTMFTEDFSGNPIEFKAFQNEDEIFN
jgi:extradiol dioxygenase family protein